MSDSRNKTDSGQDCQGTWIIHLNSEQIHKAILRGLIILVESIWSAAFGIWVGGVFCLFLWLASYEILFFGARAVRIYGCFNLQWMSWNKIFVLIIPEVYFHLELFTSVWRADCFHAYIIQVTHNVCCICYRGLYLALDICTNLGELNLLNTQNNLLKEPPVKPWWFGYGSSGLNCNLPSFSVELIQKIIFSRSEFDHIIGKMFIIINCCTSGTLVSGSLLFDCTKWGKFRLLYG